MPPPRFKAVCTETGREFGTDDLVCGGYVRDDLYKPIGLYWSVEFEGLHQNTKIAEEVKLCQSTGLTDSRGVEVFEGDVVLVYFPKTDEGYVYSLFFFQGLEFGIEGYYFPEQERPKKQRHRMCIGILLDSVEAGGKIYCIGNRWQPAAELKARAEAVSNGQS